MMLEQQVELSSVLKLLNFTGRFIMNQPYDQLPVGLLAQWIEHCNSIAEIMGSNPIRV